MGNADPVGPVLVIGPTIVPIRSVNGQCPSPNLIAPVLLTLFQLLIFLMGVAAVILALYWMVFFRRSNRRLGSAMVAMLIEQIVSASGVLFFSAFSLLQTITGQPIDQWNMVPPIWAILMRAVMFCAILHSTTRLSIEVQRVLNEIDP